MDKRTLLYDLARSYLNAPYKWGGDDISGIDCSGFIVELLKSFGLVPHIFDMTAKDLYKYLTKLNGGKVVETDVFGACAFFGETTDSISHIALCLGGGLMIEAGGGGSNTNTLADAIRQNAFVRIRPIKNRKDLCKIVLVNWGF